VVYRVNHAIRQFLLRSTTGEKEVLLTRRIPSREELRAKFQRIDALGIYLHIPFCEQICPYCPYNKELYRRDIAKRYADAVKREIDLYADIVGNRPITSFYIGGGTPTTMLYSGLADIIDHVRDVLNLQCDIHMESHPNHLSAGKLDTIVSMGVQHLSIGVEALLDRHLQFLCRPYTAEDVREAVGRAVSQVFKCVNVDVIFALPGQTGQEIERTGRELVALGVDQVAAYPLFRFPYTRLGRNGKTNNYGIARVLRRRWMLGILERIFYAAGYERTSVWAFTKRGVPRYCSVTVPLYLGLGASGGSYLFDVFYLNTFSVSEYIAALEQGRMAIALSADLSERMQRAGWLYWRIYETRFSKTDYQERFGHDLDQVYGKHLKLLALLGFLKQDGEQVLLSDSGTFWLHACQDLLSIDYISKLWGTSKREPWPEEVVL
jgi:coproporphyrinogen III oxidase-like Fe-S oxidoreductase